MDVRTYTSNMMSWMERINHAESEEDCAVMSEECIHLNMQMLDEMECGKELAPDEYNGFINTTNDLIDQTIDLYKELGRPVQVHLYELLKKEIAARSVGSGDNVIRVVS